MLHALFAFIISAIYNLILHLKEVLKTTSLQVNLFLHRTGGIHATTDTLSIYCRSGTDAARINQQRCFATPRNSPLKVHTDVHF